MPLPTAQEQDAQAADSLKQALHTLQRACSEGTSCAEGFKSSKEVLKQLQQVLEKEQALEAGLALRQHAQQGAMSAVLGGSGRRVCALVDGSSNSYAALQRAMEFVLGPEDDLYLVTVVPHNECGTSGAESSLQDAYTYAHNAGVNASRLHPRCLAAAANSGTRGVGEAVQQFVERSGVGLLVIGCRGMGAVQRSLLGTLLGLGSVSDFCLQHLPCPILVVKEGGQAPLGGGKGPGGSGGSGGREQEAAA